MKSDLFGQIMRWTYIHNGFTWSELRNVFPALSEENQNNYLNKLLCQGTDIHPPLIEKFGKEQREGENILYFTRFGIETAANHLAQEASTLLSKWALFVAILAVVPVITNVFNLVCAILKI